MKKEGRNRGIAALLTIGVIAILLSTGPAEAVKMNLNVNQPITNIGKPFSFMGTARVESGEVLDIDNFILRLNGPQLIECKFDVNGSPISGCDGIKMQKISSAPQELGYGYYTKGLFRFKFTMDTSIFLRGEYEMRFIIVVDGSEMKSSNMQIINIRGDLAGCSIRASEGVVEEGGFAKPNINFHIPQRNANNGKGTLNGQIGRNRASYKFDIIEVKNNNATQATLLVKGIVEINRSKDDQTEKEAIIIYHKGTKRIDVISSEIPLEIEGMKITFAKNC